MPKLRKLGDVTQDLEPLLFELVDHDLQMGEILALVKAWVEIHTPGAIECYDDGTSPQYFYGHKDKLKDICEKKRSRK